MVFLSATRARVRRPLYQLPFLLHTILSTFQLNRASGKLSAKFRWRPNEFWTLSAWQDKASMLTYRNTGAHRRPMPKLTLWCDEASFVHWHQESAELPNWQAVEQRMMEQGRLVKLEHPSQGRYMI
ncbi:hypothetical protein SAMD00079811_50300 [Scytonema sp. HK-05]|uniref:hypothetical protein n=1 Tax=Scytonema sp. HK-05 TaxID=1137095 RepID=UPI000937A268|nr:hypothetical protein [Scytonema sp. HK-05]OKH58024.1 hypothetical protein NIES2130_16935 [Scytonema sp. HK-05]BAY47412.1 hypothetical protein SAMD00079811_50300 [Scytonema sp. HK-05]